LTYRIDRAGPVHGEHIEGTIGDAVDTEDDKSSSDEVR